MRAGRRIPSRRSNSPVGPTLELHTFTISWNGAADGEQVIQPIYVLYGPPADNYNGAAADQEPTLFHLKMLLGPKVGTRGEWAKGASSLNKLDLPRLFRPEPSATAFSANGRAPILGRRS